MLPSIYTMEYQVAMGAIILHKWTILLFQDILEFLVLTELLKEQE